MWLGEYIDDYHFGNSNEVKFVHMWIYIFYTVYVDYDWCEAYPQWFWPPTCLYEWVDGVQE